MSARSGKQYEIASSGFRVGITEVGATLRYLRFDDRDLLWCFGEDELSPAGCGQVLAPWPNRLADGTYEFNGVHGKAAIDDESRHCAIHGLVRWLNWHVLAHDESHVSLSCALAPQPAYPFRLGLEIDYRVGASGLVISTTARNSDTRPIPFAIGFHPYLLAGPNGLDSARVELPARRHVLADQRGLPVGSEQLGAEQRTIGLDSVVLDDCYADLEHSSGRWQARFTPERDAARSIVVWGDSSFDYLMCFTGDSLGEHDKRRALAIEPMSAPPNALRSGEGLAVIEPGRSREFVWGISLEG